MPDIYIIIILASFWASFVFNLINIYIDSLVIFLCNLEILNILILTIFKALEA